VLPEFLGWGHLGRPWLCFLYCSDWLAGNPFQCGVFGARRMWGDCAFLEKMNDIFPWIRCAPSRLHSSVMCKRAVKILKPKRDAPASRQKFKKPGGTGGRAPSAQRWDTRSVTGPASF